MTRAIAQLGRATRLHARQCFFRGVQNAIKEIYLDSREQENKGNANFFLTKKSGWQ